MERQEHNGFRLGYCRAASRAPIYSRIAAFLPVKSILEIATGYGRWTRFLLQQWQWRSDRAALAAYHLNGEHDQHGWN